MSKYRGPRLRIIRRIGDLPTFTQKNLNRNTYPGQHGITRKKTTQFAHRLLEKQKLRFHYGISEKQLVRYVTHARKLKGPTGLNLIQLLEIRLDNIVCRIGLVQTLPRARQMVNHGYIRVDKKCVTVPSFLCVPGQVITIKQKKNVSSLDEETWKRKIDNVPSHLSVNTATHIAVVNRNPDRREVPLVLNELLVIEYYSNRILF